MPGPRVFDGTKWVPVTEVQSSSGSPQPPVEDGDGKIFVVIPSFRGEFRDFARVSLMVIRATTNQGYQLNHQTIPAAGVEQVSDNF